jgi:hypothetical protein
VPPLVRSQVALLLLLRECCSMADGRCLRLSPIASRLPRDASGGA